jgi:AcrR family transcriptional regulator
MIEAVTARAHGVLGPSGRPMPRDVPDRGQRKSVSNDEPGARRGRGRRPAHEVRADIYDSVGKLLLSEGMADLTFERIARLAGVSKTTLYRWWPSVGVLALDCYVHAVQTRLAFPDTGNLAADLRVQLNAFVEIMTRTPGGRVLTELIGASQTDPSLAAEYRRLYSSVRRQTAIERLRKAQLAGQIRDDVDLQVIIDQLWGAVYHRILIPDEPVTERFVESLIDNVLRGVS